MNSVDYADIPPPHVLQHPRNGAMLTGGHQEMDVITHQDVGVNRAVPANSRLMQAFEIKAAIHLAKEAGNTVIPPLDDVKRDAGKL